MAVTMVEDDAIGAVRTSEGTADGFLVGKWLIRTLLETHCALEHGQNLRKPHKQVRDSDRDRAMAGELDSPADSRWRNCAAVGTSSAAVKAIPV